MHHLRFAALLLVVALAGCAKADAPRGTISRERFVAANVALRSLDSTATAAQRDSVLRAQRVSARQLRAFVAAHARDTVLAGVWEQIAKGVEVAQPTPDSAASPEPLRRLTPTSVR